MHYASLMPHIKVHTLLLYDMDKYIYTSTRDLLISIQVCHNMSRNKEPEQSI